MFRVILIVFLQVSLFQHFCFCAQYVKGNQGGEFFLTKWKESLVLKQSIKSPSKTAVLIIAPTVYGECKVGQRWKLGKKVWEQYMNSNPDVDCYFLVCTKPKKNSSEQVWLEGNTIYVGDPWMEKTGCDRLLHKTIKALEWLGPKYTHFIRTNINTFVDLKNVKDFTERHHNSFFSTPLWENQWFAIGYSIIFTADVAEHMVNEYHRLEAIDEELISPYHADDCTITALATGVFPLEKNHPFRCCPSLNPGIRQLMCRKSLSTTRLSKYGALLSPVKNLKEAIYYFDLARENVMLYRTRDGLTVNELARLYEYMLAKIYPQFGEVSLDFY